MVYRSASCMAATFLKKIYPFLASEILESITTRSHVGEFVKQRDSVRSSSACRYEDVASDR